MKALQLSDVSTALSADGLRAAPCGAARIPAASGHASLQGVAYRFEDGWPDEQGRDEQSDHEHAEPLAHVQRFLAEREVEDDPAQEPSGEPENLFPGVRSNACIEREVVLKPESTLLQMFTALRTSNPIIAARSAATTVPAGKLARSVLDSPNTFTSVAM